MHPNEFEKFDFGFDLPEDVEKKALLLVNEHDGESGPTSGRKSCPCCRECGVRQVLILLTVLLASTVLFLSYGRKSSGLCKEALIFCK
jgi:hypothetical protein